MEMASNILFMYISHGCDVIIGAPTWLWYENGCYPQLLQKVGFSFYPDKPLHHKTWCIIYSIEGKLICSMYINRPSMLYIICNTYSMVGRSMYMTRAKCTVEVDIEAIDQPTVLYVLWHGECTTEKPLPENASQIDTIFAPKVYIGNIEPPHSTFCKFLLLCNHRTIWI